MTPPARALGGATAEAVRRHIVLLAIALYLLHYAFYSAWYIEDAAISFAFARHLVDGFGFVAYPGGERVEGYSNPSWTLLLAALAALKIHPFVAAKLLGALFGALTLPLAARWSSWLCTRPDSRWPAVTALFLAASPQFVQWNASGLENSLFSLLLVAAVVRVRTETAADTYPWSALLAAALAITRPEAPLYLLFIALWGLVCAFRVGGARQALWWGAWWSVTLTGPLVLYHVIRIQYFAWPLPNTYYAKIGESKFAPYGWNAEGWNYLRRYGLETGQGFLIPAYILGMTGIRGWRGRLGLLLSAILLLFLVPGLDWPWRLLRDFTGIQRFLHEPATFTAGRLGWIVLVLILAPAIGWARPGSAPRTLAWSLASIAAFFALFTGGDWMLGFRWLSQAAVPMAVLLPDALEALSSVLGRGVRILWFGAVACWLGHSSYVLVHLPHSPYDVYLRVAYIDGIRDRLGLDRATVMDVDMGANLWWGGSQRTLDMAGLVDVPMAHHKWEDAFVREYVYQERLPEFAHVHGGWEKKTHMKRHKGWKSYLEIPGYPSSPTALHIGNHIRRDLIAGTKWQGTAGRGVDFSGTAELSGWDVDVAEALPGRSLWIRVGLQRGRELVRRYRIYAFLSGQGRVVVADLPPAYDWVPMGSWRRTDVWLGRHRLTLPEDLPAGSYDLGFFAVGPDGVLAATVVPEGATTADSVVANGEVRFPGVVTVLGPETDERIDARFAAMTAAMTSMDCTTAERQWQELRWMLGEEDPRILAQNTAVASGMAQCWALLGEDTLDGFRVSRGWAWDPTDETVRRIGEELADQKVIVAEQLVEAGNLEEAQETLREALAADPRQSWLRRRLEALRDRRLHLERR